MKSKDVNENQTEIIQTSFRLDDETHLRVLRIYETFRAEPAPEGCPVPSVAVVFGYLVHLAINWLKENNIEIARLNVTPSKNLTIKLLKSDDLWLESMPVRASEKQMSFARKLAGEAGVSVPEECVHDTHLCLEFITRLTKDPVQREKNLQKYKPAVIPKYALVVACINLAYDMLSPKEKMRDIYQWQAYRQLYANSEKR
ncbi:hypothetical protein [Thalassospira lucentensis]|uniref:hypothetical protein n=1 Tax=Thalassospira lucentensis TaxID=168935 RepID=UPI002943AAF7|nr:hypothetical protein [Thalassospira lucentensis]WOI09013.1 hypothetical protein R1T41_00015 [Thalassospira lucentensis]